MVECEASLVHHFFDITVAERVAQVPANAQEDDVSFIMAPLEGVWSVHGGRLAATERLQEEFLSQNIRFF